MNGHPAADQVLARDIRPFSIVIPVFNGAGTLERCLRPLLEQDYPVDHFEILVIDDGSTDGSAEVAESLGIRVVRLEGNQGRIVARNTGATEARYDTLLFVDSRVEFPEDGLSKINDVDHLPQLFYVHTVSEGPGWFNRVINLIRFRYYIPRPPLTPEEAAGRAPLMITPDNFMRVYKGTTAFAVDKGLWLRSQPESTSKHESDDTAILARIVHEVPIMKRYDIRLVYEQRERLTSVLPHLFLRGPRFASFYLRPGGKFRWLWQGLLLASGAIFAAVVWLGLSIGWWQTVGIVLVLGLLAMMGIGLYVAQHPSDVLLVMIILPLIAGAFCAGLVYGVFWLGQARSPESSEL